MEERSLEKKVLVIGAIATVIALASYVGVKAYQTIINYIISQEQKEINERSLGDGRIWNH